MITTMFQEKSEKSNTYHISEPIIRRFFPKTCATSFTSVSLIPSALERNTATLRKVLAPFSFSHVTDFCSILINFLGFFSFILDFITIIVVEI